MKWTKVRQSLQERFGESLTGRLKVHQARYGPGVSYLQRRAWITWDGIEVASFKTATWVREYYSLAHQIRVINQATDFQNPSQKQQYYDAYDQAGHILEQKELYSQIQFEEAIEEYLNLSIDDALASENPLIRGLSMLDRRLGKRRLNKMEIDQEHSFVQLLYRLRCEAEGLRLAEENEK